MKKSINNFDYCVKANGNCDICPIQKGSSDCVKTLADNAVKSALKSEMSKLLDCFETCLKNQYTYQDVIFELRCEIKKMKGQSENE